MTVLYWIQICVITRHVIKGLRCTWFMTRSICIIPISGSVVLMNSTILSKESHCIISSLWLPSNTKDTLNITSIPWMKIRSGKEIGNQQRDSLQVISKGIPFGVVSSDSQRGNQQRDSLPGNQQRNSLRGNQQRNSL